MVAKLADLILRDADVSAFGPSCNVDLDFEQQKKIKCRASNKTKLCKHILSLKFINQSHTLFLKIQCSRGCETFCFPIDFWSTVVQHSALFVGAYVWQLENNKKNYVFSSVEIFLAFLTVAKLSWTRKEVAWRPLHPILRDQFGLHCTVHLYCTVLYNSIVLYCTVQCCTVLYCTVL